MSDDQKNDKTSLVRLYEQQGLTRSANLVRRGVKALQGKEQRQISKDELQKIWQRVITGELLQQINKAPLLSREQKQQLVEANREIVRWRVAQEQNPNQQCLSIRDCVLAYMKNVPSLKAIDFHPDRLKKNDLKLLSDQTSLEVLFLDDNDIGDHDLRYLKNLSSLETLSLNKNNIKGRGLIHLGELASLVNLYLNENELCDHSLTYLKNLTALKILDLSSNKISDYGVSHLQGLISLETLDICNNKITDGALVYLEGMSSLKQLWLHGNDITDNALINLKLALPSCKIT